VVAGVAAPMEASSGPAATLQEQIQHDQFVIRKRKNDKIHRRIVDSNHAEQKCFWESKCVPLPLKLMKIRQET
jgi:hypothetical protein